MTILVTGAAGFIGFHLCNTLLQRGETVIGIDNINNYYDVNLKKNRLRKLEPYSNFTFHKIDIANQSAIETLFQQHPFLQLFLLHSSLLSILLLSSL